MILAQVLKNAYISNHYYDDGPILRILPKYIRSKSSPDIGLDSIDRKEYYKRTVASLLIVNAQESYDKRSVKGLYQLLLDKFESDKVTYISTKWGSFCSGKGLLFGGNHLLAVSATQEYIGWQYEKSASGTKSIMDTKRTNRYDTYLVPLTSKDKYIKGLYKFLCEQLSSYIISTYKFYELL